MFRGIEIGTETLETFAFNSHPWWHLSCALLGMKKKKFVFEIVSLQNFVCSLFGETVDILRKMNYDLSCFSISTGVNNTWQGWVGLINRRFKLIRFIPNTWIDPN